MFPMAVASVGPASTRRPIVFATSRGMTSALRNRLSLNAPKKNVRKNGKNLREKTQKGHSLFERNISEMPFKNLLMSSEIMAVTASGMESYPDMQAPALVFQ